MGRTKTMHKITHGLAPYFKSILVDAIGWADVCTYSFEESLNEVTQSSEMDLYVRFWNADSNQAQSRYFVSSLVIQQSHMDFLAHFRDLTKDLNPSKLYQISMDGPNTNLKFFNQYSNKFAETTLHSLTNIGTCKLHIVHGTIQTGESASGWGLKNIMKSAHRILHNSHARREDYASVTGSVIYLFNFFATRYSLLQQTLLFYKFIRFKGHFNFRIKET